MSETTNERGWPSGEALVFHTSQVGSTPIPRSKICPYCGKEDFRNAKSYGAHLTNCPNNPDRSRTILKIRTEHKRQAQERLLRQTVICAKCGKPFVVQDTEKGLAKRSRWFCSRSCANSREVLKTTRQKIADSLKGRAYGNAIKRIFLEVRPCIVCKKNFLPKQKHTKTCSRNCFRELLRCLAKERGLGGFQEKGGWSKHGYYRGMLVQSTWECAYLIYLSHCDIKVERNWLGLPYRFKGRKRKFYPDFLVEGQLVEIKGWPSEETEAKQQQCPEVKFLFEKDLLPIFEKVTDLTGLAIEKMWKLYDNEAGVVQW